jgi:hypothetical protein
VSRTYLLRSTFPILAAMLEQAVQEAFPLSRSTQSLQGIRWHGYDTDDFSVIQPDQTIPFLDVMPFADESGNIGLALLRDRSLHRLHLRTVL